MSQAGVLENAKSLSTNLVQGTLKCACGQAEPGLATLQKGSVQTWNCMRCKQKVTVAIPK
jgi:hypothetical protein